MGPTTLSGNFSPKMGPPFFLHLRLFCNCKSNRPDTLWDLRDDALQPLPTPSSSNLRGTSSDTATPSHLLAANTYQPPTSERRQVEVLPNAEYNITLFIHLAIHRRELITFNNCSVLKRSADRSVAPSTKMCIEHKNARRVRARLAPPGERAAGPRWVTRGATGRGANPSLPSAPAPAPGELSEP